MSLPQTYTRADRGITLSENAGALTNVHVTLGSGMTTKPHLQGHIINDFTQFISFLAHEGKQILSGPEFDATDKSKPIRYDYLKYLRVCGGDVSQEYNDDGTIRDAARLEKGKVERRAYVEAGLLDGICDTFSNAIAQSAQLRYDQAGDLSDEAESNTKNTYFVAKNMFAQYIAVAQENEDINAIKTAVARVKQTFEQHDGHDHGEMLDMVGVAYMAADNLLQTAIHKEMARLKMVPFMGTSHTGAKQAELQNTINDAMHKEMERLKTATGYAYHDARQTTLHNIHKVMKRKAEEAQQKRPKPAHVDSNHCKIVELAELTNELGPLGMEYYQKSQGPEVEDATRAYAGHCIFTNPGEKIAVSNLETCVAAIIVNKREIRDGQGNIVAPKGLTSTCILNHHSVGQFPGIMEYFLAKNPGMKYSDLGIYLIGGRSDAKLAADFITKPTEPEMNDDAKLVASGGENLIVLKKILEYLQTHPAHIEGTCLFSPAQPMAFIATPDENGKLSFAVGRGKDTRSDHLGIDAVGYHGFNGGLANIMAAPWLEKKNYAPYIAASSFTQASKISNAALDFNFASQVMRLNPTTASRYAPIMHSYGNAFKKLFDPTLDAAFYNPLNAYIKGPRGAKAARKTANFTKLADSCLNGEFFGLFVGDPVPKSENISVSNGFFMGNILKPNPQTGTLILDKEVFCKAGEEILEKAMDRTASGSVTEKFQTLVNIKQHRNKAIAALR